ncbi:hypothetical protein T261_03923 [Streptomyces lydicus]|nr:hypothetical protein T261_03923 [Streptomyces lydicus]
MGSSRVLTLPCVGRPGATVAGVPTTVPTIAVAAKAFLITSHPFRSGVPAS